MDSLEVAIFDLLESLPRTDHYERKILEELRQLIITSRREQTISKFEILYVSTRATPRRRSK